MRATDRSTGQPIVNNNCLLCAVAARAPPLCVPLPRVSRVSRVSERRLLRGKKRSDFLVLEWLGSWFFSSFASLGRERILAETCCDILPFERRSYILNFCVVQTLACDDFSITSASLYSQPIFYSMFAQKNSTFIPLFWSICARSLRLDPFLLSVRVSVSASDHVCPVYRSSSMLFCSS